jgi:hypothetical protein
LTGSVKPEKRVIMGSASRAQVKKSLVSGLKIPLKLQVGQVGSEEGSWLREIGKLGKSALKIGECSGRPFIQLGTTGSESVCGNDDRLSCVRDGLSKPSESKIDLRPCFARTRYR